jgi:hypothetical protein
MLRDLLEPCYVTSDTVTLATQAHSATVQEAHVTVHVPRGSIDDATITQTLLVSSPTCIDATAVGAREAIYLGRQELRYLNKRPGVILAAPNLARALGCMDGQDRTLIWAAPLPDGLLLCLPIPSDLGVLLVHQDSPDAGWVWLKHRAHAVALVPGALRAHQRCLKAQRRRQGERQTFYGHLLTTLGLD